MVGSIIWILVIVACLCGAAMGGEWICRHYELPKPVLWVFGILLLIVIVLLVANQFGGMGSEQFGPLFKRGG